MARRYYFHHREGRRVANGQVIQYEFSQGGNSHTYLMKSLVAATLGSGVDWGNFIILNPTTYIMTEAEAISIPALLQPGDKLRIMDVGAEIENTEEWPVLYTQLIPKEEIFAGRKATMIFDTGENELKTFYLHNEYQQHLPETHPNTIIRDDFDLKFLNVPDDFSGEIRIENATEFGTIRAAYPSVGVSTVTVAFTFPSGVTVIASYDIDNSYENTTGINDSITIQYSRTGGGNLVLTKL